MKKREICEYCGKSVLEEKNEFIFKNQIKSDDFWKKQKRNHFDSCEWVETRAFTI